GSDETIYREGKAAIDLRGRAAVGAVVTVTLPNGKELTRQVDGGNGHSGKRSPELHFGLGDIQRMVRVTVRWRDPDGHVHEESRSLKPGRYTVLLAQSRPGGKI
ncbi:MAG TPA: ASPIC/UnbV domain-containing protein, partial [Pyrinomonadaceae bacterium]